MRGYVRLHTHTSLRDPGSNYSQITKDNSDILMSSLQATVPPKFPDCPTWLCGHSAFISLFFVLPFLIRKCVYTVQQHPRPAWKTWRNVVSKYDIFNPKCAYWVGFQIILTWGTLTTVLPWKSTLLSVCLFFHLHNDGTVEEITHKATVCSWLTTMAFNASWDISHPWTWNWGSAPGFPLSFLLSSSGKGMKEILCERNAL